MPHSIATTTTNTKYTNNFREQLNNIVKYYVHLSLGYGMDKIKYKKLRYKLNFGGSSSESKDAYVIGHINMVGARKDSSDEL